MRENTFLPIAFLALNAGTVEQERAILKAAGFNAHKPLEGVYNGKSEQAWLLCVSGDQKQAVLDLARKYNQESVLFSGIDRTCTLHFLKDNHVEVLGVLRDVPEATAKEQGSYTFDPQTEKYWVAFR